MNRVLFAYNLLLHAGLALAGPLVLPLALASAKRRRTMGPRLGLSTGVRIRGPVRPVWIHALSVGEVLSAVPLVTALRRRWPRRPLVFSASTLTGHGIAEQRLAGLVENLFFFPYDLALVVGARLRQVRPAMVILVETDLWPNFLAHAAAAAIPVALVNARLSRRSFDGYRRARLLTAPMLRSLSAVAVQSPADARRFHRLGVAAERLAVLGNLKFDQPAPPDLTAARADFRSRLQVAAGQRVLVAGSTHFEDEGPLLAAGVRWRRRMADLVWVVAPRDVGRTEAVMRAWTRQGLACCRWSELNSGAARRAPVVVVDRLGVLSRLYAAADLAFVGGSLAGCGGHNPLEPAACARPVLYGPDMSDFALVAEQLERAGGAIRVDGGAALVREAERLLTDPALAGRMGDRARQVFKAHQGGVERTVALIEDILAPRPGASGGEG